VATATALIVWDFDPGIFIEPLRFVLHEFIFTRFLFLFRRKNNKNSEELFTYRKSV